MGLRASKRNRRGQQALTLATGAVPFEGALNSLPALTPIDISSITPAPSFPYPQVFLLKRLTLVCTATQIYERNDSTGALTQKLTGLTEGITWSVADFFHYIVLANGKQLVFRDGESKVWSTNNPDSVPNALSVCNFKGQLIMTAPGETIPDVEGWAPMLDFSEADSSMYL